MESIVAQFVAVLPLAVSETVAFGLPVTVSLAAVALIGYLFGNRTRTGQAAAGDQRRQTELDRANRIAWQLEAIADGLRQELVTHHSQLNTFKRQLRKTQEAFDDKAWERLCNEAEAMLGPTMQLAHQLSNAYDQIRQQSDALETFTQGRTDPLTGVGNGRALEQQLRILLNGAYKGNPAFTVALIGLDRTANEGRPKNVVLPKLASAIRTCMRDSDFVARYGDDEFVVVMPQTSLAGARVFANRVRRRVFEELAASVCCGLTEVHDRDDARALLARADSALYSAKAAGSNRLFVHAGGHIREDLSSPAIVPVESTAAADILAIGVPSTTSGL